MYVIKLGPVDYKNRVISKTEEWTIMGNNRRRTEPVLKAILFIYDLHLATDTQISRAVLEDVYIALLQERTSEEIHVRFLLAERDTSNFS